MTESDDQQVRRPRCPNCTAEFTEDNVAWHTEPVHCTTCYRCTDKPACYTCGNMYCACKVHQFS